MYQVALSRSCYLGNRNGLIQRQSSFLRGYLTHRMVFGLVFFSASSPSIIHYFFSHDGVQKLCTDCIIDFLTWDVLQETFSCSVQHLSVANALCIGVIFLLQCSTAFRGLLWKYGC